jgi:hypothetical protein
LTRNVDGTYSPSGVPNARVFPLPNGLLIGAVREKFGAVDVTVPIIGLSNPVTTLAAIAGTYNFVQRSCIGGCSTTYGTFVVDASGTWLSCPSNNVTGGSCPGASASGTVASLGDGRWRVMHGSTNIGTAIGFNSGGQNVVILDLKDLRPAGFGVGILVGAQQVALTTAQTDGKWIAGTSNGNWASFTASGNSIAVNSINGFPTNATTTFTANAPWNGLATTAAGGVGFLAGTGVYVLETAGGYAELGIKIN